MREEGGVEDDGAKRRLPEKLLEDEHCVHRRHGDVAKRMVGEVKRDVSEENDAAGEPHLTQARQREPAGWRGKSERLVLSHRAPLANQPSRFGCSQAVRESENPERAGKRKWREINPLESFPVNSQHYPLLSIVCVCDRASRGSPSHRAGVTWAPVQSAFTRKGAYRRCAEGLSSRGGDSHENDRLDAPPRAAPASLHSWVSFRCPPKFPPSRPFRRSRSSMTRWPPCDGSSPGGRLPSFRRRLPFAGAMASG